MCMYLYFQKACEVYCLDTDEKISAALQTSSSIVDKTRFIVVKDSGTLKEQLSKYHNKSVNESYIKSAPKSLHTQSGSRSTILVEIMINKDDIFFQPGDHVGIFAENRKEIVNGILECLTGKEDWDEVMQLQILKEHHTSNG